MDWKAMLNEPTLQLVKGAELDERRTLRRTQHRAAEMPFEGTLPPISLQDITGVPAQIRLADRLGIGGMAEVWRGWQVALGRDVAVKITRADGPQDLSGALVREGRIMGGLEHPNIVPVHGLGLDHLGRPLLVMKRIDGMEWLQLLDAEPRLESGALPADRLEHHLAIFQQVCNAVHFAHSHGIVHRDLKPANVMIGTYGEVYVLDWGVALNLSQPLEDDGSVVGTLRYMAPEMMLGGPEGVGPFTDVYLLGATLHRVLTGQVRHPGDDQQQVLRSIVLSAPQDYPPWVPQELARICQRTMAKAPADRYEDVFALKQAVADYLRHRGSIDLSDAASAALASFDEAIGEGTSLTPSDEVRLYRLLGECRFGFQHARVSWPENPAALEGLQVTIAHLVTWELRRRDHEAAGRLLADLPRPDADLEAKVEALVKRNAKRAERLKALENLAFDLDPSVAAMWKAIFAVGFAFLTLFSALAEGHFIQLGVLTSADAVSLYTSSAVVVLLATFMFLLRKQLFVNSVNRLTAAGVTLGGVFFWFNRLRAYVFEVPLRDAMLNEPLIFSLTAAVVGVALDRRLFIASPIWLVGYFVATWDPAHAHVYVGISDALAILAVGWLWLRSSETRLWTRRSRPADR